MTNDTPCPRCGAESKTTEGACAWGLLCEEAGPLTIGGWRAEVIGRVLAEAWDAAATYSYWTADYWFRDAAQLIASAPELRS